MQPFKPPSLTRKLLPHLGMGVGLGNFCALALIRMDGSPLGPMLAGLETPHLALFCFMLGAASLFAVGTTLTGFIFIVLEDEERR